MPLYMLGRMHLNMWECAFLSCLSVGYLCVSTCMWGQMLTVKT